MNIIHKMKTSPGHNLGYTLIELMIVVTLIGIVSSIAYSAFTGYTQSADRAQAQADIYEIAQIMERGFTDSRDYRTVTFNGDRVDTSAGAALGLFDLRNERYDFSVGTVSETTYEIEAIPTDESRDNIDLQIDERGTERFNVHGATAWTDIGWDNID